jgi:ATP-binding cassette subfamily B protein
VAAEALAPDHAHGHGDAHSDHGHSHHHDHHVHPFARLRHTLGRERRDLYALIIYVIITAILSLIIPITAQALVNTIAQRIFVQNLIVLTLVALFVLMFAAVLQLMQLSLVETLQQRVFARTAIDLAEQLPRVKNSALAGEYGPELVNRFFDVLTVQKALAKLLLDGLAAGVQTIIGLSLLAFYSTELLGFDLFILAFVGFVFFVLGFRGLRTSIDESKQKYKVAEWLEELARCHISLKMDGVLSYLVARCDAIVVQYILARRSHFRVTFRQAFGSYFFQAVANAGTLGIGGWLVIQGRLTLGQLVAAELIILSVLDSLDKLIKQTEQFYDLLTALDKIGHVTDMPIERGGGRMLPAHPNGLSVRCRSVRFSYQPGVEVLSGLDLSIDPGTRISLVGASGAGKTTLAALLCGLEEPSHGSVEVGGVEVRELELASLRSAVAMVCDSQEIFDGTLEENVMVGRATVSHEDMRWALEKAQLADDMAKLTQGVRTHLVPTGRPLSRGQVQRLLIARAIAKRPGLLILDEAFTGIDECTKLRILDALYSKENRWTIIDISHDAEVVIRSQIVHVLADGTIVEAGTPESLARNPNSRFAKLFPDLSRRLVEGGNSLPENW